MADNWPIIGRIGLLDRGHKDQTLIQFGKIQLQQMAVFAYADETIFTIEPNSNLRALGCGILISRTEITPEVIREAIHNLSIDPDFDEKKDTRTLERKYFHASDDSKNAHSHLCNSINKHIKSVFDFTYYDNSTENQLNNLIHTEGIFKRCLTGSNL